MRKLYYQAWPWYFAFFSSKMCDYTGTSAPSCVGVWGMWGNIRPPHNQRQTYAGNHASYNCGFLEGLTTVYCCVNGLIINPKVFYENTNAHNLHNTEHYRYRYLLVKWSPLHEAIASAIAAIGVWQVLKVDIWSPLYLTENICLVPLWIKNFPCRFRKLRVKSEAEKILRSGRWRVQCCVLVSVRRCVEKSQRLATRRSKSACITHTLRPSF